MLASDGEEGSGDTMKVRIERETVVVDINEETGAGWMHVHDDATTKEIKAALALIDEAGYEELDYLETGDELLLDEQGRSMVPLVRKWDGTEGD